MEDEKRHYERKLEEANEKNLQLEEENEALREGMML